MNIFQKPQLKYLVILVLLVGILAVIIVGYVIFSNKKPQKSVSELQNDISKTQQQIQDVQKKIDKNETPEETAKKQQNMDILTAQTATDDVPVAGVKITKSDGKKIVQNIVQGYSIEIPQNLVLARSVSNDWIEFHDPELMCKLGPSSCEPIIRIVTEELNQNELSLDDWIKTEEQKIGQPIYEPREKLTINEEIAFRVTENIPDKFDGYYYYFAKGKKIYHIRISKFDNQTYGRYIETFKFN